MMREIILTNGMISLCDDEDYDRLVSYTWSFNRNSNSSGYAKNNIGYMHHLLFTVPSGYVVDHRDRNGLNNQRYNLRQATRQQNQWNAVPPLSRSGYIGVYLRPSGKYQSLICDRDKRKIHLGTFTNIQDAARAYDKAAIEQRGDFAVTNEMVGVL